MRSGRFSDAVVSVWKYLWVVNILTLKALELAWFPRGLSGVAMFVFSAALLCFLFLLGLLIDSLAMKARYEPRREEGCRGGICWHSRSIRKVCLEEVEEEFSVDLVHSWLPSLLVTHE
ncbi:hypothetical protein H6P81_018511 [Aristolochia fimbriata]|uniref:Uncharacterized protein n=1 Tax=Aristolochia fimbriata TaxID=158543 RepID=A0AAV7E1L0_ARIFI|nr:hypothetical protein H6P81_018511 [Aristolochia fimbriata]